MNMKAKKILSFLYWLLEHFKMAELNILDIYMHILIGYLAIVVFNMGWC